jgi:hypothetical protein
LHAGVHCIEQCIIITWLERVVSKPFTREIRAEDKQLGMVETSEAWVGKDGFAQIIKFCLSGISP